MSILLSFTGLCGLVSSCSEEDKLPNVNMTLTYESGVVSDGMVYIVQPDDLIVKSINITAVNQGHKATSGPVTYWLNGMSLGTNPEAPFGITIPTKNLEPGKYALQLSMPVYEEDCELSTATAVVVVNVVADVQELPDVSDGQELNLSYTLR